jgi:dCTP deaminase
MILSDRDIRQEISDRDLISSPVHVDQIQPASLDVRLGDEFYCPVRDETDQAEEVTIQPGGRILAHTEEVVDLPNDIAAQLAGRSTIGRRGIIVHKTAGWIDPGFRGQVTLELANMGEEQQTLRVGDRIAQLVFMQLLSESKGYDGKYQGDLGAEPAKED